MMLYKLYQDLPYKIVNLTVSHKNRFVTNWDESELLEPKRLADMVHVFLLEKPGTRAFVRPAGTENKLRVYVEGKTDADVTIVMNNIVDEIKLRFKDHGADQQALCFGYDLRPAVPDDSLFPYMM
mmetsp:Transcript_22784/g.28206  ORF Transcript_22784/g.28206 Transcript_22784/m.28206 type:complete len:125 (-) Transcript_22784:58-432(-)